MITVFEMFSGYGGASFALKKANLNYKTVGYSEIDKTAIKCFNNNFPGIQNFGDCRNINPVRLPNFNLLTAGFPCQPFSGAGKHLGIYDTRGTLFHDIIRIAEAKKPDYIVLENVKGLTFNNHKKTLQIIIEEINRIGYSVNYKVLNSKNYGTPQSRERVVFVCIKSSINNVFKFPNEETLTIFLKDLILNDVPKEFYLKQNRRKFKKDKFPLNKLNPNEVLSVAIRNKNRSKHQIRGEKYGSYPIDLHLRFNKDIGVSYTVKSAYREYMISDINLNNIRCLTPKESFRLMGFFNDEINLKGISKTGQYKLAGNGWDINLFSKIFKSIYKPL